MRLIDADEIPYTMLYEENFLEGTGFEAQVVWKSDIDNIPTVDAVPARHGRWVGINYDGYSDEFPFFDEWKCSECGCTVEDEEPAWKYCPNCGARMDGERKDE